MTLVAFGCYICYRRKSKHKAIPSHATPNGIIKPKSHPVNGVTIIPVNGVSVYGLSSKKNDHLPWCMKIPHRNVRYDESTISILCVLYKDKVDWSSIIQPNRTKWKKETR